MKKKRQVPTSFVKEMNEHLQKQNKRCYTAFKKDFKYDNWPSNPEGSTGYIMNELQEHVSKLFSALWHNDKERIQKCAVDVSNFAMIVAEFHKAR